jgi:hypothetical protein
MTDWREWDLEEWNKRLLGYFFSNHDETPQPVVVLLVTADELVRATGDPDADADEVRDSFVDVVRTAIRRSNGLLEDAAGYAEWPERPRSWSPPPFVAHLLFTCIAASESSDELGDEASFISRLRDLTDDQLPDNSLQILPRLWQHLADWLAETPRKFRPLLLPNPGSLTRIGYTVKLAFPDRRDQKQLSELLDRAGLLGHEPPAGRVLTLVSSQRSRFRPPFLQAFDEFRRLFDSSAALGTPQLVHHRFWAAVREGALRGRGQADLLDVRVRLSLLAEEEEDRLAVFPVADQRTESVDVEFADLPIPYGSWRFALMPKGGVTLDAAQLERTSRAIFDGSLRLPIVSSHVEQGLVPFVLGAHGLLELARQEQLGEVAVALVRETMVADLVRVLGQSTATTRPSSYEGWVQVHGPMLHALPSAKLDGTSLSRTWILHESLRPTFPRLVGGVRADDGWLGVREVLPRVVAPGASAVALKGDKDELMLSSVGDETWTLPVRDFAGEFTVVASLKDAQSRRTIRFHATPASELFKPPSDPEAWIVEQLGGTGTLASSIPFRTSRPVDDFESFSERVAYLGPDVGTFVAEPGQAAWRVTRFGGRLLGSRGLLRGQAARPSSEVESAHARRRWRKMLFESTAWLDPDFDNDRRRIKSRASAQAHLPRLDLEPLVPNLAEIQLPRPSDSVDRLVRILCGRASTRSGIDWREWTTVAQRVLDIDSRLSEQLTRAWMEAGLVDIASSARWWYRVVFARSPRLVAFNVGEQVGATLSGLVLPTTIDELRRTAVRLGCFVEERYSVSPLVPSTVTLRASKASTVEELARACQLRLCWLDLDALTRGGEAYRHDGTSSPPQHYERTSRWSYWSLKDGEYPDVFVEHRMRPDRPDYWLASCGGRQVWFYDLNVTRAWAAALVGEPVVNAADDSFIEANHAFLPLPIARALSVLGAALSGPTGSGYRYVPGAPQLRRLVLDIVTRTFNPSRLPVSTDEQRTG